MEYIDRLQIGNYQDCWSILYIELANALVASCGIEGENALREGVRRYGSNRGHRLRQLHKKLGLKPNLENLFTYYDLPDDPRFKREKIRLNEQERLSNTLVCPIASLWLQENKMGLGRIYCEEFHHAMFCAYAPMAQVNLAKTLTEEGDDHCCFSIYLRPGNMEEKARKETFKEYDHDYRLPSNFQYPLPSHKDGFNMLCIKLIYFITEAAADLLDERGIAVIEASLNTAASRLAKFMHNRAEAIGAVCNQEFLNKNLPINFEFDSDDVWRELENDKIIAAMRTMLYNPLQTMLQLEK